MRAGRLRPTTPLARVLAALAAWALLAAAFRGVVAVPERCGDVSVERLRASVSEAVGWFDRNERPDGRWLYRYDRSEDRDLGGYNTVRHAGVTMSLYQAAEAGFDDALSVADRGAGYVLDHLVRHDGWAAFHPDEGWVTTGATGLVVAGLVHRRAATGGDDRYDAELDAMGRFLVSQVEPSGAVLAYWDPQRRAAVAGTYSIFYTGEAYWALALLHTEFPDAGWDEPARRVGRYLATERDEAEDVFPRIFDHWAAYGLSVTASWPDAASADRPLTGEEVDYARRQAGLGGMQVRWESQRTDGWPNRWLRGRRAPGAGLGTIGESLTSLWLAAGEDERLADLREPLAERAVCAAAMLTRRQVDPAEAEETTDPRRTRGAWFASGVTQMDDQQHALSAVLRAVPVAEARGASSGASPGSRPPGSGGPGAALLVLALLAAMNPGRAASALPDGRRSRSAGVGVVLGGGAAAVAVLSGLAWLSGPLLDWLSVSAPTVRIGAAVVLVVVAVHDLVARPPSAEPALAGRGAAAVPVAVPLLLRPHLAVLAVSAGVDGGVGLVAAGTALGAGLLVPLAAAGPAAPATPRERVERWLARLLAAVLAVVAVAMAVDGVFAV